MNRAMKKIHYTVAILFLIMFSGCTKEDAEIRFPQFEVPQFKGYYAHNEAGNYMGRYGMPNVNLGDQDTWENSRYHILMFPNPAHNRSTVFIKSPVQNQEKKLWLTRAIPTLPFEPTIVESDTWNNFVAGGAPLLQGEFTQREAYLDISALPDGYYRLYVEMDGLIFYDNLLIDRSFRPNLPYK